MYVERYSTFNVLSYTIVTSEVSVFKTRATVKFTLFPPYGVRKSLSGKSNGLTTDR